MDGVKNAWYEDLSRAKCGYDVSGTFNWDISLHQTNKVFLKYGQINLVINSLLSYFMKQNHCSVYLIDIRLDAGMCEVLIAYRNQTLHMFTEA